MGTARGCLGGGLLIVTGTYTVVQARRAGVTAHPVGTRLGPLTLAAALSVDHLVVGFALRTSRESVAPAAVVIAVVSVGMALVGLELGARPARSVGERSGEIGGALLVVVGVAIAAGWG